MCFETDALEKAKLSLSYVPPALETHLLPPHLG